MNNNEILTLRMNMLKGMDTYIREVIGDDDITYHWNIYGVSDNADETDLKEIAEDEELWCSICGDFGLLARGWGNYIHLCAE